MEHKAALVEMITRLLEGDWSVPEFQRQFYDYYLEKVPGTELSDRDAEFFGAVQEKLDWTDINPDPESKKHGWINQGEYVQWVRYKYWEYLKGKGAA